VAFDGSASSDPDGTIAKYEWDLDGNGSFETSTGTTASASRIYTAAATLTVGLRVTDNDAAATTTTRSLVVNSAYRTAVLGTAGIVDLWRLDETTGSAVVDANGTNNNGTYVSSPTSVAALISGETNSFARTLNGSSQYLDFSPTPFGTPAKFSAEAWVRTSVAKASGGYHFIFTNSSSEFSNGISLVINSSNRPIFVLARQGLFSVTRAEALSSVAVAPNTTHHIVGTYDGTRARIFVDGVERGSDDFSGAPTWSSSRDMRIGRPSSTTSLAQRYLQGTVDEPALYNAALPLATVLAHYNAGKP
jgi:hypothetical protein